MGFYDGCLNVAGNRSYYIGGGYRQQLNNTGSPKPNVIRRQLINELNRLKRLSNTGLLHAVATSNQTWAIDVMRELGFYESPVQLDLHHGSPFKSDADTKTYGPNGFHFVMFFMPVEEWEPLNEN